jgi:hypothetical protein
MTDQWEYMRERAKWDIDIDRLLTDADALLAFKRAVRSGLYEDAPFLAIEDALAALPERLRAEQRNP